MVADALSRIETVVVEDYSVIAKEQENDDDLRQWLAAEDTGIHLIRVPLRDVNTAPTETPSKQTRPVTRSITRQHENITRENDTTASIWVDDSCGILRPFIPVSLRKSVFEKLHNTSHPGITGSHHMISQRFMWPYMRKDIKEWVRQCTGCQRAKSPSPHQTTTWRFRDSRRPVFSCPHRHHPPASIRRVSLLPHSSRPLHTMAGGMADKGHERENSRGNVSRKLDFPLRLSSFHHKYRPRKKLRVRFASSTERGNGVHAKPHNSLSPSGQRTGRTTYTARSRLRSPLTGKRSGQKQLPLVLLGLRKHVEGGH